MWPLRVGKMCWCPVDSLFPDKRHCETCDWSCLCPLQQSQRHTPRVDGLAVLKTTRPGSVPNTCTPPNRISPLVKSCIYILLVLLKVRLNGVSCHNPLSAQNNGASLLYVAWSAQHMDCTQLRWCWLPFALSLLVNKPPHDQDEAITNERWLNSDAMWNRFMWAGPT